MNYLNKVLCLIKCTNVTAYVEKTPKVPPNPNVLIYKEKYLNKNKKNLKIQMKISNNKNSNSNNKNNQNNNKRKKKVIYETN